MVKTKRKYRYIKKEEKITEVSRMKKRNELGIHDDLCCERMTRVGDRLVVADLRNTQQLSVQIWPLVRISF